MDSLIAEVLACLLDGQTITQREFYERFSTVNIARHTDPQYIRDVYAARKARGRDEYRQNHHPLSRQAAGTHRPRREALRPIVEGMGMKWQAQLLKLRRRFDSTVTEIVTVADDGKQRRMLCLPLK